MDYKVVTTTSDSPGYTGLSDIMTNLLRDLYVKVAEEGRVIVPHAAPHLGWGPDPYEVSVSILTTEDPEADMVTLWNVEVYNGAWTIMKTITDEAEAKAYLLDLRSKFPDKKWRARRVEHRDHLEDW